MFVLRYCDVAVFVSEVLSHLASFTFNIFQYFSFTICEAFSYIVLKITKIVAQLPTD